MKEILTRIEEFEYIKTEIFPENVILNVSEAIRLCIGPSVDLKLAGTR